MHIHTHANYKVDGKPVGKCLHLDARMHADGGKPENMMPPAPSTKHVEAEKSRSKASWYREVWIVK